MVLPQTSTASLMTHTVTMETSWLRRLLMLPLLRTVPLAASPSTWACVHIPQISYHNSTTSVSQGKDEFSPLITVGGGERKRAGGRGGVRKMARREKENKDRLF